MAKLPIIQQLQRTDFPDAPSWITKLLYPLQLFMTSVINALTNQLTIQDNTAYAANDLTFIAGASPELNAFSFMWPYNRQPIMLVMHISRADGTTPPIYAVPSWNLVGTQIMVNGVTGLTDGVSYKIQTVVL